MVGKGSSCAGQSYQCSALCINYCCCLLCAATRWVAEGTETCTYGVMSKYSHKKQLTSRPRAASLGLDGKCKQHAQTHTRCSRGELGAMDGLVLEMPITDRLSVISRHSKESRLTRYSAECLTLWPFPQRERYTPGEKTTTDSVGTGILVPRMRYVFRKVGRFSSCRCCRRCVWADIEPQCSSKVRRRGTPVYLLLVCAGVLVFANICEDICQVEGNKYCTLYKREGRLEPRSIVRLRKEYFVLEQSRWARDTAASRILQSHIHAQSNRAHGITYCDV